MLASPNTLHDCDFPTVRSWLKLPDDAAALVAAYTNALDALGALERAGFLTEAAQLVAHAVPKRDSVRWACICADHTAPPSLPPADQAAREAAGNWVQFQTDLLCRYAWDDAEAAGLKSPEAWAAVAAFWSGRSIAPAGKRTVPPPPKLTGTAVWTAIQLAAVRGDPDKKDNRLRRFLGSARDIAGGGSGGLTNTDVDATVKWLHGIKSGNRTWDNQRRA